MKNIEKFERNKCRTCYNSTKGLKLLKSLVKCGCSGSLKQKTYAELLREISNINIMEDTCVERLPQSICEICAQRLIAAHSFIEHAQEVNERLLCIASQLETTKQLNGLQVPSVNTLLTMDIKVENNDTELLESYEPPCFVELKEEPEQSSDTQIKNTYSGDILNIKNYEEAKEINKSLKELTVANKTKSYIEDNVSNLKSPSNKVFTEIDCNSNVDLSSDDDKINSDADSDWKIKKKTSPSQNLKKEKKIKGNPRKAPCNEDDDLAVLCNECHKIFSNAKKLAHHKRNTHIPEDQKCTCPICERRFSRSCNMYKHMRTFHGPDTTVPLIRKPSTKERIYQCDKCDRNYIHKSRLKVHIKEKHSKDSQNRKGYTNKATEQQNTTQQNSGHEIKEKERFLCTYCGQSFNSKSGLESHDLIHTDKRPFSCDICDKTFKRLKYLQLHRVIHSDEKPYQCTKCSKAFKRVDKLKIHMRVHSELRPYKCSKCEKTFKYQNVLRTHMHIHTGPTPFAMQSIFFKDFVK